MSQQKVGRMLIILNLFSLNTWLPFAQSADNSEARKNEQESARIQQINEINSEIRKTSPVGAYRKKPLVKITGPETSHSVVSIKPEAQPSPVHGYIRNAKGPDQNPAPPPIKVKTDDTPESLSFPGTND